MSESEPHHDREMTAAIAVATRIVNDKRYRATRSFEQAGMFMNRDSVISFMSKEIDDEQNITGSAVIARRLRNYYLMTYAGLSYEEIKRLFNIFSIPGGALALTEDIARIKS